MSFLNIDRAHILGISMGGAIAQEIAIRFPERVKKLVLAATWAGQDAESGFSPETIETSGLGIRRGASRIADLSLNKFLNRLFYLPLIRIQCNRMGELEAVGLTAQKDACSGHDVFNSLSSINAPTLVLVGTKDRTIKPSSSETLAKLIPNARLVKINNGSHTINWETHKIFNKEVLDFLLSPGN